MEQQLSLQSLEERLTEWKIKSVIVRRGGQWIDEWHERGADTFGPLYSCTKSVLSALLGIAIDKGLIESVEQPITNYFNPRPESSASLQDIKIKHLLTMTPGFEWPDFDKPYKAFRTASDPLDFVLTRPLVHVPGESFTYNSGASHLLSAILTKATGMSAVQFAKEQLFQPLGFRGAKWLERDGVSEGGTGLSLYGRDLAKLGMLFLQEGRWEGKRLLSSEWVRHSTKLHHRGLLLYEPPIYGGYGFHWWCSPAEQNGYADGYFAYGHGGQYLMVMPEKELVIVVRRKATKRNDGLLSRSLIFEHILPRFG